MLAGGTGQSEPHRPPASVAAVGFIGAAALLALYVASGPRTLPEADSGELAAVAVSGGIPHPPGYPLLVVLLRGFAALAPVLGLIPALALSSYLAACAGAVLLMRTLAARGTAPVYAALAVLVVFASRNVWRDATSFEPFALNLLLASALVACSDALGRAARAAYEARCCLALGALFGLGLCNHHSLAMLAPLPLCILLVQPRRLPRRIAFMTAGFSFGLLPLAAFAWLRTGPGWVWGDWSDFFPQLLHHVLRRDYGTLTLSADARGQLGYGPLRMLGSLPSVLSYVFVVPGVLGLWTLARRSTQAAQPDGFVVGLATSFVTSALVFPALFQLEGTELDHLIADRFLAMPMLLLVFPLAAGLSAIGSRLRHARAFVTLLLVGHVALQWPEAARVHHRFFEAHVRNVFDVLEQNAVLMVVGDGGFAGGLYGKYALGRGDVTLVISGLNAKWHERQIAPAVSAEERGKPPRPLYLLDVPDTKRREIRAYPVGPLLRVLGPREPMPSPQALFEHNRMLFSRLRLPTPDELRRADAWERDELPNYARTWRMLAERLEAAGDQTLAAQARAYGELFESHAAR